MRQTILLISFNVLVRLGYGQSPSVKTSFEDLKTVDLSNNRDASFSFDSTSTLIYNARYSDLKSKPENFVGDDLACDERTIIISELFLDKAKTKKVLVTYGICPETEFYIQDFKSKKYIGVFSAFNLIIPGNGAIYSSGHMGNFNVKRKYTIQKDTIIEDKQPFYYVGLKSKTLRPIKLYSDKDMKTLLAVLSENYEIEILLTDAAFAPTHYLVRTSFGLTGWAKLEAGQYKSIDVDGLFYNND